MLALRTAIDELITRATTSGSMKEIDHATNMAMGQLESATAKDLNDALHRLAKILPTVHTVPAGAVAITCGAAVEHGGDPNISGEAVLGRLPDILLGTRRFHEACRERAEADGTIRVSDEEDEETEEEDEPSEEELAEKYINAIREDEPDAVFAYLAERSVRLSAIAHLGRSKPLRGVARSRPELLAASQDLDGVFGGGHGFLTKMLLVLDGEPILVLDTDQSKGFRITLSGVPDNFNLHTLLMANLVGDPAEGWIEAEGIDLEEIRTAANCLATHDAPSVSGLFNLWNWPGVQPDGTLMDSMTGSGLWIWNEGVPADILSFESTRVIVLGPSPYSRGWNGGRVFDGLEPEFRVDEKLPVEVVTDWLKRLGSAPRPDPAT